MSWPGAVYSLSHLALPIDRSDPLYRPRNVRTGILLGNLALRGERGQIRTPPGEMLRLR